MRISRNEEWEGGGGAGGGAGRGGGIPTTGHPNRKISADSGSNQNADELMKPSTSSQLSLRIGDKRRLKEFPSSSEIEQKLIFRHHRIPILIQI